jgi:retron-type reverse transcriptase
MDIFKEVRKRLAFSESELDMYLNTAPFRYKTYKIAKRNGGTREISQPSRDLKILQRFILRNFLNDRLVCHNAAMAYRPKRNITDNVRPHITNPYLLKMDFKDFFPSIRIEDFVSFVLDRGICVSEHDARNLGKVFFKNTPQGTILSIGSPGSPAISNAMLFEFDQAVYVEMSKSGISYTRYSDDMAFSTNQKNVLFDVPLEIKKILDSINYPILAINHEKTVFSSKKFNRHITGITISNEGNMSLGHLTKRHLRSRVYGASEMNEDELSELRGYLAFAFQIEPELLVKLSNKYPLQMRLLKSSRSQRKANSEHR